MLVIAVVLQGAEDSSEIENIIIKNDELYKALTFNKSQSKYKIEKVRNCRISTFIGYEVIQKQDLLSVNDVIKIQQDLIENNEGIRSILETVLKNYRTGEIIYVPLQDKTGL